MRLQGLGYMQSALGFKGSKDWNSDERYVTLRWPVLDITRTVITQLSIAISKTQRPTYGNVTSNSRSNRKFSRRDGLTICAYAEINVSLIFYRLSSSDIFNILNYHPFPSIYSFSSSCKHFWYCSTDSFHPSNSWSFQFLLSESIWPGMGHLRPVCTTNTYEAHNKRHVFLYFDFLSRSVDVKYTLFGEVTIIENPRCGFRYSFDHLHVSNKITPGTTH